MSRDAGRHEDVTSLAWVEEFGSEPPSMRACSCEDCLREKVAPAVASSAFIVTVFALVR
jgi:hypothetical protein